MYTLIGKTGFVWCVGQRSKWRMSIIFCLIALCIAPFELVMPVFSSVLDQYQTFIASCEPNACGGFIRRCLSVGSDILTK